MPQLPHPSSIPDSVFTWAARGLAMLFILFISLFALDVFEPGVAFWSIMLALLIHLIPSLLLAASLIVAWKRALIGGILFIAMGVAFTLFFQTYRSAMSFVLLSVSLLVIGALFILDAFLQK